jgi:hypothetical protein
VVQAAYGQTVLELVGDLYLGPAASNSLRIRFAMAMCLFLPGALDESRRLPTR